MIEQYYDEELRYLQEAGAEFARAYPERARYLNIDAVGDRDPYVERLFEGFAFLAARVREKLDDSFPELTEGLIDLMWPAFLETIPSCTIVQFQPRRGMVQETRVLPRGAELLSGAVGAERCVCRFLTVFPVPVHPLQMSGFERITDLRGRETLRFTFSVERGVRPETLVLDPLRLFVRAEPDSARLLHYYMSTCAVEAGLYDTNGTCLRPLDPVVAVGPAAACTSESLLPDDIGAVAGHRQLIDYFVFPEKNLFLDLGGLGQASEFLDGRDSFVYSVTLGRRFPADRPFDQGAFRLYCSPAVNIFNHDCEPVLFDGTRNEVNLVADSTYRRSMEVSRVCKVSGIDRISGHRREYSAHMSHAPQENKQSGLFAVKRRRSPEGRRTVSISLTADRGGDVHPGAETIVVQALCTNGNVPREELGEGDINRPGRGFPDTIMFTNITRPTLPCSAPERSDYLWTFLSQLSASLFSIADPDILRSLLLLYEWSGLESRRRIINAICAVSTRPADRILDGEVMRGVELVVEIGADGIGSEGDMHLFGGALHKYLQHFVTINSFVQLVLVRRPEGMRMEWCSLRGKRWPI